jgi:proteasome alpha subunit
VAMQFYASPEQVQRDRSEYARKGIARGRSAVVLTYEGGVLMVAENITTLRKISEIYDKIGFAAVGRYNEFENLRRAGVRMADLNGYSYDRRDVTGRGLANAFTQTLGAIFSETQKPYEVEICIAQVGATPEADELYRITYDGSVMDEPGFMAMGGQAEAISNVLRERHDGAADLHSALALAAEALGSVGGENGQTRTLEASRWRCSTAGARAARSGGSPGRRCSPCCPAAPRWRRRTWATSTPPRRARPRRSRPSRPPRSATATPGRRRPRPTIPTSRPTT